jgi:Galactose oxidase, central domain
MFRLRIARPVPLVAALLLSAGCAGGSAPGPSLAAACDAAAPTATSGWVHLSPRPFPPPRLSAAVFYDPISERVILFGGSYGSSQPLGDTWAWDGKSWTQLRPKISPAARYTPGVAFDEAHGRVIMFGGGGTQGKYFSDTWTWDGSSWLELHPATVPPGRIDTFIGYAGKSGRVSMFAGSQALEILVSDGWTWDGANWVKIASGGPLGGAPAVVASEGAQGRILTFGGQPPEYLDQTWAWDGQTWTELHPPHHPSGRNLAAMVYDPLGSRVLMFGGLNKAGALAETWTFDGLDWHELHPQVSPSPRYGATMVYDSAHSQVVLFGGGSITGTTTDLCDTWVWKT